MKLTIQRMLDTNKYIATEAGQSLQDFISYVSSLSEQVIRGFRNELTFQENFRCEVKTVTLNHNVENVVNTSNTATGIFPIRVTDPGAAFLSLSWYYNAKAQVIVKPTFTDGLPHEVVLVILN